jgi:Mg-chelatase subunit ChlD
MTKTKTRMAKDLSARSLAYRSLLLLCAACADSDESVMEPSSRSSDAAVGRDAASDRDEDATDREAPPKRDGAASAEDRPDSRPPQSGRGSEAGAGSSDPEICASVRVETRRVLPEVILLIDGSGSMVEPLGAVSRWGALRDALLGPEGVVPSLEKLVAFGMTVYSTPIPMRGAPITMCPDLLTVPPALDNLAAISSTFPPRPTGGFTPTGEAVQGVVDSLKSSSAQAPQRGRRVIVLATDGEPNSCEAVTTLPLQTLLDGRVPVSYAPAEAAIMAAQAADIDTYVVSLAPELTRNAQSRQHLQALANLGQGLERAASPGAELFSPQDPAQLDRALRSLVGSLVSCDLTLEGKLAVAQACDGDVRLNGEALACTSPDGWEVVDESTIRLRGTACEKWKREAKATVEANFPCEAILLQ